MRHRFSRFGLLRRWLTVTTALTGALSVLAVTAPVARANPEGGTVVQGAATITQTNPQTVTVNQTTDRAVINWPSFNIGTGETVRFNQPSSTSATLNRVTGDQVSNIQGNLSANGRVYLVNPNGIVFGAGSKIDVAALVASTADIKTDHFMAGNLRFDIPGKAGAEIINRGTITAADGGLVALISPVLRNSGIIQARLGKVALASANGVTLDLYGDNLILFQAADRITQQMVDTDGRPVNTAIDNSGQIYADGGRVLMTANTAKGVVDSAINTTGLVSARTVEQQGGEIVLLGEDGGTVQVAGRLDASGTGTGQTGGRVSVQADGVVLANGAVLDASGDSGGGKVTVGGWNSSTARMASGAAIDVSAKTTGNGGEATVIAADADVAGSIHARGGETGGNGGMIETSGHFLRVANIGIDASARRGLAGQWLLDPYDLTVDAGAASSISSGLNTGTNVSLLTTANSASGPGNVSSGNGDIIIASALGWTGSGNLSLSAHRNIQINAAVTHGGSGLLTMTPDNAGTGTGSVLTGRNGSVKFTGTGGLRISGHDYTLIRTVEQLQAMGLTGYYALGGDVDASATADWNGGAGFMPIYTSIDDFFVFDGLGNKISRININYNKDSNYSGLFSSVGRNSTVGNLNIVSSNFYNNSSFYGSGSVAGANYGIIYNSSSSGIVGGFDKVGGLVGYNIGIILNSSSSGSVFGSLQVGGLVGYDLGEINNSSSSSSVVGSDGVGGLVGGVYGLMAGSKLANIKNSTSSGDVNGYAGVGGLVGYLYAANVYNSSSTSNVSGEFAVGGIVGEAVGAVVKNSSSGGRVTGKNFTGGVAGQSYAEYREWVEFDGVNFYGQVIGDDHVGGLIGSAFSTKITNSSSSGNSYGIYYVGGLVGGVGYSNNSGSYRILIKDSYSDGLVDGDFYVGGMIGGGAIQDGSSEITNSFWNTETTGQSTSYGGGTGLTTAQMNDPTTFTNAGWDTSVWDLAAGRAPTLKAVGPAGAGNGGSAGGGGSTDPGHGGGSDIDPPLTPDDNPLMGLDAEGLYATILSNGWADSYRTNSYWLEVAEASGAYLSDAQKKADIMLQAWARYRNYSGQALAEKLYLDYMNRFKIGDTVITNSPANPIWYGAYGSAAAASAGQRAANIMIQAYSVFGSASTDEIFAALLYPTVRLPGITDPQPFTASPENVVWSGIYGADLKASQAQVNADHMMNVRRNLYGNASLLARALRSGIISMDSLEWKALKDGWGTGSLYLSAVQRDALEIIRKQSAEERAREDAQSQAGKDIRDIERDRIIGVWDPTREEAPGEGKDEDAGKNQLGFGSWYPPRSDLNLRPGAYLNLSKGAHFNDDTTLEVFPGGNLGTPNFVSLDDIDSSYGETRSGAGSNIVEKKIPESIDARNKRVMSAYGVNDIDGNESRIMNIIDDSYPYSIMAVGAYGDGDRHYTLARLAEFNNDNLGFSSTVYRDTETGEVTISFRGTYNMENVLQDIDLVKGGFDDSTVKLFQAALDVVERVKLAMEAKDPLFSGASKLTYTGHSLGGALATYAALMTGNKATTFNSAPLSLKQIHDIFLKSDGGGGSKTSGESELSNLNKINEIVTHIRSTNDPLTSLDRKALIGDVVTVENANGGHSSVALSRAISDVVSTLDSIESL